MHTKLHLCLCTGAVYHKINTFIATYSRSRASVNWTIGPMCFLIISTSGTPSFTFHEAHAHLTLRFVDICLTVGALSALSLTIK